MTVKEVKKQTHCAYCNEPIEVCVTEEDITLSGKNVQCFSCGGVLWLDINKKGNDIKIISQLPFVLLNQEKSAKDSQIEAPAEFKVKISPLKNFRHLRN